MSRAETIASLLKNKKSVFLSGPGGTGKSYTIRKVVGILASAGLRIGITASTGVAALNISGGKSLPSTTLHSWAGIGLATEPAEFYIETIKKKSKLYERWKNTDVLIIDEISMLGEQVFDLVNIIGQYLRVGGKGIPFGGLTLLVSGDFLQLPPVKDNWIFESESWKSLNFSYFIFEEPKRYDDVEYFEMLLRIRKAAPYQEDVDALNERVKAYDEMMKLEAIGKGPDIKPTILYSRKIDVSSYNNQKLAELPGLPQNFVAEDTIKPYSREANFDFYTSMLDEISPRSVQLKVGAQVMLTFNVDVQSGLANGSRGVVKNIDTDAITVKFLSAGIHRIERITVTYEDQNGIAYRKQYPFILAWAMTIHKSQGNTIETGILDLGPSVFSAGGAYVALSRVKSLEGIYLSNFDISSIKASKMALSYTNEITNKAIFVEEDEENEVDKKSLPVITNWLDDDIIQNV